MPTPSHHEEMPQVVAGLPISFDRKFRPWRYSVSHSELKLRTVDKMPTRDLIEVTFHGVVGMKLKTVYQTLDIALAGQARSKEMLEFSDVRDSQASRVRCIELRSRNGGGWVACLGFSIWSHPRAPEYAESGLQQHGSVLILSG